VPKLCRAYGDKTEERTQQRHGEGLWFQRMKEMGKGEGEAESRITRPVLGKRGGKREGGRGHCPDRKKERDHKDPEAELTSRRIGQNSAGRRDRAARKKQRRAT